MLHFPNESQEYLHEHLNFLADENVTGISLGIKNLEDYLLPLSAGDLGIIIARPGQGKSSLLAHLARQAAEEVSFSNADFAPPLFVSNEMPLEELQLRQLSFYTNIDSRTIRFAKNQNDWNSLHTAVKDMQEIYPIIYLANSLYSRGKRQRITIELVEQSVENIIEKYEKPPRIVCIDYLQRMQTETSFRDRRLALNEIVERSKDMALYYGVPFILGSQASREVDTEQFPVPSLRHGKETGGIEEAADWVISAMRPSRYFREGEAIPHSDHDNLIVEPNLFFIKVLKQRSGDAGRGTWCKFDMRVSHLSDLELVYSSSPNDE